MVAEPPPPPTCVGGDLQVFIGFAFEIYRRRSRTAVATVAPDRLGEEDAVSVAAGCRQRSLLLVTFTSEPMAPDPPLPPTWTLDSKLIAGADVGCSGAKSLRRPRRRNTANRLGENGIGIVAFGRDIAVVHDRDPYFTALAAAIRRCRQRSPKPSATVHREPVVCVPA
ncbi:MAG: hypothetical protein HPM95_15265 [Alphaproteobacteria bacterium]|nr:hypothetical protein [Alphaproteobacteria bacterium]